MTSTIALSAGEASGDLNGAYLVQELKKLRPGIEFWGAGGPMMRQAGVDIRHDTTGGGTIGISATLKSLPRVAAIYLRFRRDLLREKPDLFIPIDFGAFNVRLAQVMHKRGVQVIYYFPPSSWRKTPTNAPKLRAAGGKVITPFPWSAGFLSANGIDARFVGHPLVDIVKPTVEREEFLRELGLSELLPTIGLLPGSRGHEISEHVAPMVGCAHIMHRELGGAQFVIGASPSSAESIRRRIRIEPSGPEICVAEGRTYDCMAASDMLISKSGTATLEAAMLGIPMVIVYRGTAIMRFEYHLRKHELGDHIGMPNIIAGRGVCPELLNEDVTAEKLADITLDILRDKTRLANMRESLLDVRRRLGDHGAVERIAQTVVDMGGLH